MKKIYFILVLLTISFAGFAQNSVPPDSVLTNTQYDRAMLELNSRLQKTSIPHDRILLENKKVEVMIHAGKYDEAERALESILIRPLTPFLQAVTKTNRGFLYLNQGRNDLALSTLQEALLNIEKENKQNTLEGAQILSHLGNLYLATGKYTQAEEQLDMALAIRENLVKENSELLAASYNDLGLVYSITDANKALDHYEKAAAIYERIHGKNHPKIAIANANMGFAYRTLEFYGDAINNFESALLIWEKIYPQSHPTKAFILFNLGQTYLKMGNEKSAEGFYDRALKMYQESYGRKHPGIATVLNAMGSVKLSTGKYDEALNYYQQALIANVRTFNQSSLHANPELKNYYGGNTLLFSLLHKAEALEARYYGKSLKFNEFKLALNTLHVCDTLIDVLRQQITNESDKILLGTIATEVYASGVRIAYEAGTVSAQKKYWYARAFYFAEKSKSAVLLEAISESNAKSFSGIPDSLLEAEKKLKAELALTTQRLALKPSESEEQYLREVHFLLKRNYETFIRELETKFPDYYNLKFNILTPSIKNLQDKLNSQTAIISYFTDDQNNRLYIFQITDKNFQVKSHNIPHDFDRNLNGLRNSLVFNELETFKSSTVKLSDLLVPKTIPAAIKELVILPTGRLSIIPFEVLFSHPNKNENTYSSFPYLIKRYSIRYEFSAALLLRESSPQSSAPSSIFLCAPITFDHVGLAKLPGTEAEVIEISKLFAAKNLKSNLLTHHQADEKKVKHGELKNFSFLHFATHGIVDETNPELSRIFLHAAPASEDGNLFAGEIYNLELNAQLVTLSACQTGLGKLSKGEGVIGLSRALVYAGSKNVMVSFWSVADASTSDLMKTFYAQMLNNNTTNFSTALRHAKLKIIEGGKYTAPFYWAPFILIGF